MLHYVIRGKSYAAFSVNGPIATVVKLVNTDDDFVAYLHDKLRWIGVKRVIYDV